MTDQELEEMDVIHSNDDRNIVDDGVEVLDEEGNASLHFSMLLWNNTEDGSSTKPWARERPSDM